MSFCIQNIVKHLTNLRCSPEKVGRIYNNLKDLNTKIQEEKIETIVEYGLHQFVTQFIRKISSVDNEIHKEFFN